MHQTWYLVFGRLSQIFKTRFSVQTLISQPSINQIKRSMDQNLSWLIINLKQFQFFKSEVLFPSYAPLNNEPVFDSPGFC